MKIIKKTLGMVIISAFLLMFCFAAVVNGLLKTFITIVIAIIIGCIVALGVVLLFN